MSVAEPAPPSERATRRVLWGLRWLTILAAAGAGFGLLVWKLGPRPLELQVEFVLPQGKGYELFVNGRSLGYTSVLLDGERLEELDDHALSSLPWPPAGMFRFRSTEDEEVSVTTGFGELESSGWVMHMWLRDGRRDIRRALTFRVLDPSGREAVVWSDRKAGFADMPGGGFNSARDFDRADPYRHIIRFD